MTEQRKPSSKELSDAYMTMHEQMNNRHSIAVIEQHIRALEAENKALRHKLRHIQVSMEMLMDDVSELLGETPALAGQGETPTPPADWQEPWAAGTTRWQTNTCTEQRSNT